MALPWQHRLRRSVLANLRVVVLLWRRFRLSLTLFLLMIVGGSLILSWGYRFPEGGRPLSFSEALYAVFSMLFFQPVIPFPEGPLQILFFLIPIVGLSVVAEGLISFSVLLLNRNDPSGEWTVAMASTYSGHVVVCGLGHVGFRVVQQLLSFGQEVVGVEQTPQSRFADRVRRRGVPVIPGDATDLEVLRQAGVERARAIVVATNDPMVNLEIVLNARQLNKDVRVVLRMFDADVAERLGEAFGIRMTLSASAIAAPAFASAAIHEGVTHSFFVEGDLLHVSEVVVQPEGQLVGRTVGELEGTLDLSVIFHQRGDRRDMHPPMHLALEGRDKIIVFAQLEKLEELGRLNCPLRGRRRS